MNTTNRHLVARGGRLLAALASALAVTCAHAQEYPSKAIRIIVPFTPGGGADVLARLMGDKLREKWGQPVIIENRPGANSVIGTEAVARAAPDGHTLLVTSNAHVVVPLIVQKLSYGPSDFAPVAAFGTTPYVLSVHPSVPAATVQDFIALARKKPGQMNFGSSGAGTGSHLAGEAFNMLTGTQIQHVPYKGGQQALTDAIGGQVQLSINTPLAAAPHIQAGRLKPLAVTGDARVQALPQVPTFKEAGLPAYDEHAWIGLFAPAATPRRVIDALATEVRQILATPSVKQAFDKQGVEPLVTTPEQFAAFLKRDTEKTAKVVKAANIKLD